MSKVILFSPPEGGVAVVVPTEECLKTRTIEEIAEKDVPAGLAYKIIDQSELPSDRDFRDAWEIDTAELTDGVGADRDYFV
jgi:hypothetical protein